MRASQFWIVGLFVGCGAPADPAGPSCLDPARGPQMSRFADITAESGIDFAYTTTGFQGGGLAVLDLDGDGLPEVVAGRRDGGLAVYRNRGGLRFDEVTTSISEGAVTALAAADLDNDGDRDLVIAGGGHTRIIANDGALGLTEIARLEGTGTTEHVLPVDLDGDGRLDLYLSNYDVRVDAATQNRVYRNRGSLAFEFAGLAGAGLSWTATAFDLDGDGDQDLHVANDTLLADFGKPGASPTAFWPSDLVLRNDGIGPDGLARFTDLAKPLGLDTPRSSMGGVLGDLDEDGRLDLYIPDFGANKLFVGDATGGFVDRARELGVAATTRRNALCDPDPSSVDCLVLSWSAAFTDFDLDGYDEILIINGETSPGNIPPVVVLARGATEPYAELAPEIPCLDARGLVTTDLDGDGDAEVIIAQREGALLVYENRGRPVPSHWLRVTLDGRTSNRDGVGAVVTLQLAGGRTLTRVVGAGGVVHTAGPAEAAFGVGTATVERITVQWPSGRRSEVLAPALGATHVIAEE
ncbi:MAG: CRTAC1 family protein [Kofleriaceae bacterium]